MDKYQDEAIRVLNDLLETCKDGEQGFRQAADGVTNAELRRLFLNYGQQRSAFIQELRREITSLGGDPDNTGSVTGALHRGWINIKQAITGKDEAAIVSEAERGEDVAVRVYQDALNQNLPASIRALVQKQYTEIKQVHDEVRNLERQYEVTKR